MEQVIVSAFGGIEQLHVVTKPAPDPGPGEVRVALTSIGMNHADLMARRGEYKLSSGEPPFTPGLEGGGSVDATGPGVTSIFAGQRVVLGVGAPRNRRGGNSLDGTYRSHFIVPAEEAIPAPDALTDEQLGALWLTYLTAWGCLAWRQQLQPGQIVGIPAASSGVGLAAAQITRSLGGIPIGLTTSPRKIDEIKAMPESDFEHVIATSSPGSGPSRWHRQVLSLTDGHGIDVFFDPVAAGDYLNTEIRCLAHNGTIWVYGLLGEHGIVDVTPLIRKNGAIRGWLLNVLSEAGGEALQSGYRHILEGFASGRYRQRIAARFPLSEVRQAHEAMESGNHIGKLILVP